MTQVVYPELPESNLVKVYCGNEEIQVLSLKAWTMAESNPFIPLKVNSHRRFYKKIFSGHIQTDAEKS